jgi:rhodanese-related sulfurtransferase
MFGFSRKQDPRDVSPERLKAMLDAGEVIVVDVREPHEYEAAHIAGAVNLPLSCFDPSALPNPAGRRLVLNCVSGRRSARALAACDAAQASVDGHLAGGIEAWAASGLPIARGA